MLMRLAAIAVFGVVASLFYFFPPDLSKKSQLRPARTEERNPAEEKKEKTKTEKSSEITKAKSASPKNDI